MVRLWLVGLAYQDCADLSFLCSPGRFFAVNELKAMVAYLVLNYDVKMENEGVRPNDLYKGARISPDPVAEVLFKRRKN